MLNAVYPGCHERYSSLPVLGPTVDGFATWLVEHRYASSYIRQRIWLLSYMDSVLIRRGVHDIAEVEPDDLAACRKSLKRQFPYLVNSTEALEEYLRAKDFLAPIAVKATGSTERYLAAYRHYLKTVRGAAASTIQQNAYTASEFLTYLKIEKHVGVLKTLTINHLERFVKAISHRFTRVSLQRIVYRLRSFLRFLAVKGEIPQGLDRLVDGPRVFRDEQLPGTLPWEVVEAFLNAIDRSSLRGLRDFTMFLLMAIYGLRGSDVVALTLDDIHWRAGKISITQKKTGTVLELPLTDTAGAALHKYLRKAPPPRPFRQIFLSVNAPIRSLKTTAISTAFRVWARRTGMEMPGRGACHRIRHSYAVFLLRKGTPVKTIGDILGHRTLESTWPYLRLAIEDLRDVALSVPAGSKAVWP